jgi:DNA-binding transcriptional ArsR family regulator
MNREQKLDRVFHALADSTRRAILRGIARGPRSVGQIASRFPLSLAAVSKHLHVLESTGLIRRDRDGQRFLCSLRLAPLEEADQVIRELSAHWESRLDELEAYLRERKGGERSGE